MLHLLVLSLTLFTVLASERSLNRTDLLCSGRPHYNVTLTAYYPDFGSDYDSDYLDMRQKKLRNLQDFIDGRAEYVTAAMDVSGTGITYGTNVCVPQLNEHYGRRIPVQIRDYGNHLSKKGFSRLDICVRSEMDSYDKAVNRVVTVYL